MRDESTKRNYMNWFLVFCLFGGALGNPELPLKLACLIGGIVNLWVAVQRDIEYNCNARRKP